MVLKMKIYRATPLWVSFALISVLSWAAYYWLPALHSYPLILAALAVINLLLGFWVIYMERFSRRSIIAVIFGIVIGQWWIIVWSIVFIIWRVKGFAP